MKSQRKTPVQKLCTIEGCGKPANARGWCQKHYYRWKTHGDPLKTIYNMDGAVIPCSVDGCPRKVFHTARKRTGRVGKGQPLCPMHYYRLKRGEPMVRDRERGDGHYRGGYRLIMMPDHPDAQKSGYIAEHRLVMETMIGRRLLPEEQPHHKNGVRDDNAPGNLELWSTSQPAGQRVADKLAWARRMIELYEPIEEILE